MAAKRFEAIRKSLEAPGPEKCEDGDSSDSQELLDDMQEVFKDLDEMGWLKIREKITDLTEIDLNDPKDYIRVVFQNFAERRSRRKNTS